MNGGYSFDKGVRVAPVGEADDRLGEALRLMERIVLEPVGDTPWRWGMFVRRSLLAFLAGGPEPKVEADKPPPDLLTPEEARALLLMVPSGPIPEGSHEAWAIASAQAKLRVRAGGGT